MNWLKESVENSMNIRDSYSIFGIQIYILNKLPKHIDMKTVVSYISTRLPRHLLKGVDVVYVGDFQHFQDTDTNALYKDGAIYTTNKQSSDMDMIDDIIHEIAHSVEEEFTALIYRDGKLNKEFLAKRRTLYNLMKAQGIEIDPMFKIKPEYDKTIDNFLYKDIGYEMLTNLVNGLYISAYACTSIREYFARGFEEYFMGDRAYLRTISPVLYNKIELLDEQEY